MIESVYQDVKVLLDGFHTVVPDGVLLYREDWGASAEMLADAFVPWLQHLQQLSVEQLHELEQQECPGFLGLQLEILCALPPEERIEHWHQFVHG